MSVTSMKGLIKWPKSSNTTPPPKKNNFINKCSHFSLFDLLYQGLLDDLDATLVSEVYASRPSSIYSFYSTENN